MAMERPLVATDVGGTRELAEPEVHGLIRPCVGRLSPRFGSTEQLLNLEGAGAPGCEHPRLERRASRQSEPPLDPGATRGLCRRTGLRARQRESRDPAQEARQRARERYDWTSFGARASDAIEEAFDRRTVIRPTIGRLSSWALPNQPCRSPTDQTLRHVRKSSKLL